VESSVQGLEHLHVTTRVLSADQYIHLPRPHLAWLVPSYVPRPGLVLLIGEPKSGKSFLALQLALAVAAGTPFLGQSVAPSPVLYLQFDTSETGWRQRLHQLQMDKVPLPDTLFLLHPDDQPTRVNILSPESYLRIKEAIDVSNPALIVVDVLRECHNADEQDSTEMKVVGDTLMTLCRGRTLLLVHHTHKLNSNYGEPNPVNAARGSSYITGKADAIWLLHNNLLQIASRFHHDEKRTITRMPNGLWAL